MTTHKKTEPTPIRKTEPPKAETKMTQADWVKVMAKLQEATDALKVGKNHVGALLGHGVFNSGAPNDVAAAARAWMEAPLVSEKKEETPTK